MQGKTLPPRGRDAVEVLCDEGRGPGARPRGRHGVQTDPAGDVRNEMGGVPDWIAQGNGIEVDEDHLLAREEDVVGLQVRMDRRRPHVFQARRDGGGDGLDPSPQVRTGPLHQGRSEPDIVQLVGDGVTPRDPHVVLIERGRGPGNRARRAGPVETLKQDLLQRSAGSLLQRERA